MCNLSFIKSIRQIYGTVKKFVPLYAIAFILAACQSYQAAPALTVTQISQEEFYSLASNIRPKADTELISNKVKTDDAEEENFDTAFRAVQLDIMLPEPKYEAYYDAILPNNFFAFTAFQNGCDIFFAADGIKSFTCYINDQKIETEKICALGFCKADISQLVKNGKNIIYIANVVKKSAEARLQFRIPYPILSEAKKNIAGINYEALKLADQLLKAQIEYGFPSAQLLVVKDGVIIKNSHYGKIFNDTYFADAGPAAPVTDLTLYDMASNTKIFATLFAVQRLVFEKKLSTHDPVKKFFPEFADGKNARHTGKNAMTIENLLTHSSGFPAGAAYYTKKAVKNASRLEKKQATLKEILKTPLIHDVGTEVVYSDINFMLLSFIIEKVTGQSFDTYVEENIYEPLQLHRICFKPAAHGFSLTEIAATEYGLVRSPLGYTYHGFAHGAVHDPECYAAMNEVSGHAGLFANAESIAVLAQTIINGGGYGNTRLFDTNTVNTFLGASQYAPSYALGWRKQNAGQYKWAFSGLANPNTVGHTGWTGTLTLIDTENNLAIILLTNAKHSKYVAAQKYEGDYYLTKNFGALTSIIYSAFTGTADNEFLASMLVELAENKYNMILSRKRFKNSGAYSDLASIMAVIKNRKSGSKTLQNFLKSDTAQEINSFLKENLK